jgi:preprotein translocase subunit SecF
MANHKPFRELVKPGSNFEFIGKQRTWVLISVVAILASIGMLFVNKAVRGEYLNWTIDFRGGTEMVFAFSDTGGRPRDVGPGEVRGALQSAGFDGFDVSDFSWTEAQGTQEVKRSGVRVVTPDFGALADEVQQRYAKEFTEKFADRGITKVTWSGDRMFVRSTRPVSEAEGKQFFTERKLQMRPWAARTDNGAEANQHQESSGEYTTTFDVRGIDAQYEQALSSRLDGVRAQAIEVYGVGAKAGAQLRSDGIKSLFYAMILIMLYLVVRFDVRFAPAAVIALLHDAILTVGVFAVTWTEFSLTTVAALLTIIGYSVNDTVVIFDRIRENVARLKDKKLPRIINISVNETLGRSLLTALTVFLTTLMMNIFGSGAVRNFAFAMNIGVIVGAYSSIFVASPIVLYLHNRFYASSAARARVSATPASSTP